MTTSSILFWLSVPSKSLLLKFQEVDEFDFISSYITTLRIIQIILMKKYIYLLILHSTTSTEILTEIKS